MAKVKVCPRCGSHNLETAWNCEDPSCRQPLSQDDLVEIPKKDIDPGSDGITPPMNRYGRVISIPPPIPYEIHVLRQEEVWRGAEGGERFYEVDVAGVARKPITCEWCGRGFDYPVLIMASGRVKCPGFSFSRISDDKKYLAMSRAYGQLQKKMDAQYPNFPGFPFRDTCPYCGKYSRRETIWRIRERKLEYVIGGFVAGIFGGSMIYWLCDSVKDLRQYAGALVAAIGLFIWGGVIFWGWRRPFDPNLDAQKRIGRDQMDGNYFR